MTYNYSNDIPISVSIFTRIIEEVYTNRAFSQLSIRSTDLERRKPELEAQVSSKKFNPSDVIASLLTFMKREFSNDPKIIHTTIARLRKDARYKDLLEGFDFLNYDPYPYSPLLGRTLNRPAFMPAPSFMIKAIMGELGSSLLHSQRAVPKNLIDSGYPFLFLDVDSALKECAN